MSALKWKMLNKEFWSLKLSQKKCWVLWKSIALKGKYKASQTKSLPNPLEIQLFNLFLKGRGKKKKKRRNFGKNFRKDYGGFNDMIFVFHPAAVSKISPRTLIHQPLIFLENRPQACRLTFSILIRSLGCSFTIFSYFTRKQDSAITLKLQYVSCVQLCNYK